MSGDNSTINIGGLYVDKDLVKSQQKSSNGWYTLTLTSGETFFYPKQELCINKSQIDRAEKLADGKTRVYYKNGKYSDYAEAPHIFNFSKDYENETELYPSIKGHVEDGFITDTSRFSIFGLNRAALDSSDKNIDDIKLFDCYDCTINLGANESQIWGDRVDIVGGGNNKVGLDDKDTATIKDNTIKGPQIVVVQEDGEVFRK